MVLRHLYAYYLFDEVKFGADTVKWVRLTSFYVLYPAWYLTGVILTMEAMPVAKPS